MRDPQNRSLGTVVGRIALLATTCLALIGAMVVAGQLVIQRILDRHTDDSKVVNVAGRQRMLSQRLAKAALAVATTPDSAVRRAHLLELEETANLIERVHRGLQHGDRELGLPASTSADLAAALRALDPSVARLSDAARALLASIHADSGAAGLETERELRTLLEVAPIVVGEMEGIVQAILDEEPTFLARMEQVVAHYELEARDHLRALKRQEATFGLVLLAVLSFLGAAVLLPAIRELRRRVEHREIEERLRLSRSLLEATMREREMIGKDLHDGLGQVLAGIAMMVRTLALRLSARRGPEVEVARKIEHLVGDAIAQTRDLARALHPVEISDGGLEAALRTLAESASATLGAECTVVCEGTPPPTDDRAKTHLYRIAQEAVSNAVKHGKARRIEIRLAGARSALTLTITDDGSGLPCMPPEARGLGLGIMADRARLLGGRLEVRPAATGGTTVAASFDGTATLRERLAA